MTDQAIRNLNLKLHLMKKNIFFSFLLKNSWQIYVSLLTTGLSTQDDHPLGKLKDMCSLQSFLVGDGGNCSFYSRFKQELDPLKLDDCHRFFRSHLRRTFRMRSSIHMHLTLYTFLIIKTYFAYLIIHVYS